MIEKAAADRLGLAGFGELYVAGMAGRIQSRFRKANTLSLGPLTIDNPLFMCVTLAHLYFVCLPVMFSQLPELSCLLSTLCSSGCCQFP